MAARVRRTHSLMGRVLVVDDDPALLDVYARTLADAGFEVARALGGSAALRNFERQQFDLVLVDASMPGYDGFTLLRRMRTQTDLPAILMLDGADNVAFVQAFESGEVQTLIKPITPDLLRKAAAAAIQRHRSSHHTTMAPSVRSRAQMVSVTATEGKNEFGHILESAIQGKTVVIKKHNTPKAVLISVDEFNALSDAGHAKIESLSDEFDALLARMQTPKARRAMTAAFSASPKQMGRAAVALAAKRGN